MFAVAAMGREAAVNRIHVIKYRLRQLPKWAFRKWLTIVKKNLLQQIISRVKMSLTINDPDSVRCKHCLKDISNAKLYSLFVDLFRLSKISGNYLGCYIYLHIEKFWFGNRQF